MILALDTSSPVLSVALVRDGEVVAEASHPEKAGDLLPHALLRLAEHRLHEVTGIAVGLGPGSFTGLRVGLASAKALAYARKWPIAGTSSLKALAWGMRGRVWAALEARKGELFVGPFEDGLPAGAERVVRADALDVPEGAVLVGHGAETNRAALGRFQIAPPRALPAVNVARLCESVLRGARFDLAACFALAPNYLQAPTAEVALAEGRVGGLPPPRKT